MEYALLAAFFCFTFIAFSIVLIRGKNGSDFPYNTFLNEFVTRFGDYYVVNDHWVRFGWGESQYGLVYLPALYILPSVMNFFLFTPQDSFKIWSSLAILVIARYIYQYIRDTNSKKPFIFIALFFFSYPFMFSYSTGNTDLLVLALLAIALDKIVQGKYTAGSILLGIAAAPKGYPLLFLLICLPYFSKVKSLKPFFAGLLSFFAVNFIAIVFLKGGFLQKGPSAVEDVISGTIGSMKLYADLMIWSESGMHFGHSLIGSLRVLLEIPYVKDDFRIYLASLILFIVTISIALKIARNCKNELYTFIAISAAISISLPTSTDYRLLTFVYPLVLILSSFTESLNKTNIKLYSLMMFTGIFIITPKPYLYFGNNPFANAFVWLTPFLLMLFLLSLLKISKVENSKMLLK
jgi:hypothetical protein